MRGCLFKVDGVICCGLVLVFKNVCLRVRGLCLVVMVCGLGFRV